MTKKQVIFKPLEGLEILAAFSVIPVDADSVGATYSGYGTNFQD